MREPNDIRSYAALACIAIQSNQNDQHGGKAFPILIMAWHRGCKTYARLYKQNMLKALELLTDLQDVPHIVEELSQEIGEKFNLRPSLSDSNGYKSHERQLLSQLINDEDTVDKVQKFAEKCAWQETDRATYQAMEAFVHNLNTMHSRAGAQIPFSSINYGTDITGRKMVNQELAPCYGSRAG